MKLYPSSLLAKLDPPAGSLLGTPKQGLCFKMSNFVSIIMDFAFKMMSFAFNNDELHSKSYEFCIKNDEFCI